MSVRFVNIDRETPMLLPPDLREWVREDYLRISSSKRWKQCQ